MTDSTTKPAGKTRDPEKNRSYRERLRQAAIVPGRRCECGIPLSIHNPTKSCAQCERLKAAALLKGTGSAAAKERLAARKVVGIYVQPERCADAVAYLAALSEALNELTLLVGPTPPDLTGIAETRVSDPAAHPPSPRSLAARTRAERRSVKEIGDSGEDAAAELLSTIHGILVAEGASGGAGE